jgi:hypothetical protein
MSHPNEASPRLPETIQEVQGIFPTDAALQDAVGRLTRAGFDRAALALPAANPHPSNATPSAGAENPNTDDDVRQIRTLQSSMAATAAAMVGAGVTIATGGAALAAGAVAVGLGAAAGGAVSAAQIAGDSAHGDAHDRAAAAGQLVLSAAAPNPDAALKATQAMQAAGATRVATITRDGNAVR